MKSFLFSIDLDQRGRNLPMIEVRSAVSVLRERPSIEKDQFN